MKHTLTLMILTLLVVAAPIARAAEKAPSDAGGPRSSAQSGGETPAGVTNEVTQAKSNTQNVLMAIERAEDPDRDVSVSIGNGWGMKSFGSYEAHDLAMLFVGMGWRLTRLPEPGEPLAGTLDLRAELCTGYQYSPSPAYVVGLAPLLRYNFQTGTAFTPFIEVGVGVNATDIGEPDLGSVFQFSPQGGVGLKYLLRKDLAITAEYRFLHLSNAGLRQPNEGVNTSLILVGLNWLF